MPEPYIQLREIDRRIADFDSREDALKQERQGLERRLQSIELVKNLDTDKVKALTEELASVNTKIAKINELTREVDATRAEYKKQLDLIPAKISKAVAKQLVSLGDIGLNRLSLADIQLRKHYKAKFAQTKIVYEKQLDSLAARAGQLAFHVEKLQNRANAVKRLIEAWHAQQPVAQPNDRSQLMPTSNPQQVAQRLAALKAREAELAKERGTFNSRDGKTGDKAKLRLQGDLLDRVNAALRAKGFVDPIDALERVLKSIGHAEIPGTAMTFLLRIARSNRAKLLPTLDPHDIVRVKAFEGDAAPALSVLIDKFCNELQDVLRDNDSVSDAVRWWKTRAAANVQLAALDAQLSSKLKFRFRRAFSDAVGLWIKQNLD
jgi:hypothetical protein